MDMLILGTTAAISTTTAGYLVEYHDLSLKAGFISFSIVLIFSGIILRVVAARKSNTHIVSTNRRSPIQFVALGKSIQLQCASITFLYGDNRRG